MIGFHERLRSLRLFKKMTLDDLAQALETTKTTLSRYENNKRIPDAEFIVRTTSFFKVSSDYLLGLSNNPATVTDLISSNRIQVNGLNDEQIALVKRYIHTLQDSEVKNLISIK
jgi:transcriptional regulator with XRE-family HTH domain